MPPPFFQFTEHGQRQQTFVHTTMWHLVIQRVARQSDGWQRFICVARVQVLQHATLLLGIVFASLPEVSLQSGKLSFEVSA